MLATKKSQMSWTIASLIIICLFCFPAYAKYSGGTGEPNDPYQIATAEDLILLGQSSGDYDRHFILTADIDLDPNLPGRKVFDMAIIAPNVSFGRWGIRGTPFNGVFDGNGHTISNLTIIAGTEIIGLFGWLASGAEVKDLGVVDVNVTSVGPSSCGGLVGGSGGDLTRCYSTGAVTSHFGVLESVGGLVGSNSGSITDCYSTSSVSGTTHVGGLVGENYSYGKIANCYAIGSVLGKWNVGGLVGRNFFDPGPLTASFWDTQTSGRSNMCGSEEVDPTKCDDSYGKTTAEMQTASTFLEAGWDFVNETANGTEDIWWILEGQDYPRLWWEATEANFIVVDDFESYNDLDPPEDNRIFTVWIDGYGDPNNGSIVGYDHPPFIERNIVDIVHSGMESMSFGYDNRIADYSEATANIANLAIGRDWTKSGARTLSLWFNDDPYIQNDAEPMYVALANANGPTAAVYNDDPDAALINEWTEWTIDLQAFANQGVDLTNINTISIGFGDKNNPQPGGSGVLYFDDIRLYRPAPKLAPQL